MTTDQVQAFVMLSAMNREDTYRTMKTVYPEMQEWEFESAWERRATPEASREVHSVFWTLTTAIILLYLLVCGAMAVRAQSPKKVDGIRQSYTPRVSEEILGPAEIDAKQASEPKEKGYHSRSSAQEPTCGVVVGAYCPPIVDQAKLAEERMAALEKRVAALEAVHSVLADPRHSTKASRKLFYVAERCNEDSTQCVITTSTGVTYVIDPFGNITGKMCFRDNCYERPYQGETK